ncbi:hypothetical protein GYB22_00105 [bacterium]|nr:hypothetical protein [bacterium]
MSKIIKISLITLGVILGLLLILWGLMQTESFQQYLSKRLTSYLSKELKTTVKIGHVKVKYFDHLELQDFEVLDQNGDSMIHIGELEANYDFWSWSSSKVGFDYIRLDHADVKLGIPEGDSSLNLQFVISYFSAPSSAQAASTPVIQFDKIDLVNCRFNYFNKNYPAPQSRDFNENNIDFRALNGTVKDFQIINDSLVFETEELRAKEQCGLVVKSLDANCIISSTLMEYSDLKLLTERSDISNYLAFHYTSYFDFSDFIAAVDIDADLDNSEIHSKDLAYFANELKAYDDVIVATGLVNGTIDNIHGENVQLAVGDRTEFVGQVRIKGIPEMDDSYWDIDADVLVTNSMELGKFLQMETIPKELDALGDIAFSGRFMGFLNEFVGYGDLSTALGNAQTDIKFGVNAEGAEKYSGSLSSESLNLAPLLNYNNIGSAAFDLSIEGEGMEVSKLNANIKGDISFIEFNDYKYQNITLDGLIKENYYSGFASIKDENLDFEFDGSIDATVGHPVIDISAYAKTINLKTLGLDTMDSYLSFEGDINLEDTEDDIYGVVSLDSISLKRGETMYPVKGVELIASSANPNSDKQILLKSDLVNMQLTGKYRIADLPNIGEHIIHFILPHEEDEDEKEYVEADISLIAEIPAYHPILEEYLPELFFEHADIQLLFDSEQEKLQSSGSISELVYEEFSSDTLVFNFARNSHYDPLLSEIHLKEIHQNDTFLLKSIDFAGEAKANRLDFILDAARDSTLNANIDAYLITKSDSVEVYINHLDALINSKLWQMENTDFANVVYHDGATDLFYILLRNQNEIIFLDGTFGEGHQKLSMVLEDFLLENLNPFLESQGFSLGGKANGFIDVNYVDGYPIFESDLNIADIAYDDDTLGQFFINSHTGNNPKSVTLEGTLEQGIVEKLNITGDIDFNNPEKALDIKLITDKSPIAPFGLYLEGLASELDGYLTANISIAGPFDNPNLGGTAELIDAKFKVDYLQTQYTAKAEVEVGNDYFKFKEATIKDRFGKTGNISGAINHKNFRNFNFDIDIKNLKEFECMNTKRKDNELFYGTAYADGSMQIKGPLEDILLVIDAKSRKGTKIFIPLDNIETDGQLSYVEFVDFDADNNKLKDPVQTTDGVRMDFNFDITNDAEIELIFDELLGDKIKGAGHGNLRMEINTYGDFNMYGKITIDRGNYLFTAFNFINKYFTVEPGGTLLWDGDPYNAQIDLVAVKREYPEPATLLAGLVSPQELENYEEPVPVDCELKLTGLLFNPNISFGLSFPSTNNLSTSNSSTFNTVVERIRQDPEELNRQVFALIALGTFIPPSFANGSNYTAGDGLQNTVNNSLSDFVSSQLNNWLSQANPEWQFGVDYQAAAAKSPTDKAELILSIKKSFWNERIEFQGSYDAASASGNSLYDVNLQYNLNEDGSFKLRGFHRNANDPTLGNLSNVTTSGVGLFYRHQFDYFWFNKPDDLEVQDQDSIPIVPSGTPSDTTSNSGS